MCDKGCIDSEKCHFICDRLCLGSEHVAAIDDRSKRIRPLSRILPSEHLEENGPVRSVGKPHRPRIGLPKKVGLGQRMGILSTSVKFRVYYDRWEKAKKIARGECQPQVTPFVVSVLRKMPHVPISMVGEQTPSLEGTMGWFIRQLLTRYVDMQVCLGRNDTN